ncbi:phosphoglycerate kinase [Desulfonema ishimotonii]|uniref:Phosphoglycerate kinase n=1 Tax=Desulfonema ishimotonii TaxID=45657 RepID=A0A401G456_9BACT|nr:phosphoglycerate kinase [Desulfonema ishimotonii]GBC64028.1 phosphoglycerate kinase [Desulfonema ishimotonii]
MRTVKDIDFAGRRVFVRVDFNVPLDEDRNITDDSRIRGALPTLEYALSQNAKLIVASHLGRPRGRAVPEFSLAPVAKRLSELLGRDVRMAPDCIGPEVTALVDSMADGEVLLLENLRYHAGEQENDAAFGRALAELCDVYVNDAFAVCHRVNASVAAITEYAPVAVAGLLLQRELDYFSRAMADPQRPLVAVIGGAKVSSKLKALENMLDHVDKIIIGGAMANTFLRHLGHDVGQSKYEADQTGAAGELMARAGEKGIRLCLPVDVVAGDRFAPDAAVRVVPVGEIPPGWMALDIGPATAQFYDEVLCDAKTVVWNGPMGAFEMDAFSQGTLSMVSSVVSSQAMTIVGGGDTAAALHKAGKADRVTYVSTGGGAFLTLLEGRILPAVQALDEADVRNR